MALTSLDPNSTAVIGMDLQEGIVSVYTPNSQELVARAGLVQVIQWCGAETRAFGVRLYSLFEDL